MSYFTNRCVINTYLKAVYRFYLQDQGFLNFVNFWKSLTHVYASTQSDQRKQYMAQKNIDIFSYCVRYVLYIVARFLFNDPIHKNVQSKHLDLRLAVFGYCCTVGKIRKIYTPRFSFFRKIVSISRFQSWNRSRMKSMVILHSIGVLTNYFLQKYGDFKFCVVKNYLYDSSF